jgi:hypothetical protein
MVRGFFRAVVATLFISMVLVVSVPKHYVHSCDHEHTGSEPLGTDAHTAFLYSDHHCAICDLVIPSYTSADTNRMVFLPWVSSQLSVLAPPIVNGGRAEQAADRGPPVLS